MNDAIEVFGQTVGSDWASDSYEVCVVGEAGRVVGQQQFEPSGEGIGKCIEWLRKLAAILRAHRIRRVKAEEVLERLCQPALR